MEPKQQDRLLAEIGSLKNRNFRYDEEFSQVRQQLRDLLERKRTLDSSVATAEGATADIMSLTIALVAGEVDEKQKPRFSNSESRKAEVHRRLAQDTEYQAAKSARDKIQAEAQQVATQIAIKQDEEKSILSRERAFERAITLTGMEVAVLTGGFKLS